VPHAEARLVSVADGDTITILVEKTQHRIRLYGIDCPEKKQAFCNKTRQYTSDKVFGKEVAVEVKDVDQYGRKVGVVVLLDGLSLNHMLVNAGLAWHYGKYAPDDQGLATLEKEAAAAEMAFQLSDFSERNSHWWRVSLSIVVVDDSAGLISSCRLPPRVPHAAARGQPYLWLSAVA